MLSGPEMMPRQKNLHASGKAINLETHDEICVLMDHAITKCAVTGSMPSIASCWKSAPEGSDELRLLRSSRRRTIRYSTWRRFVLGLGVCGFIGPGEDPSCLIDIGFSQTAVPGMAMGDATHSPGDGWWMTTGAALPLNDEAMDRILDGIEQYKRRHG